MKLTNAQKQKNYRERKNLKQRLLAVQLFLDLMEESNYLDNDELYKALFAPEVIQRSIKLVKKS